MTKRKLFRLIAIVLAVIMPILTASFVFAGAAEEGSDKPETKYVSPDINEISGHGEEPEELSASAGADYLEKAWYEYVVYSDHAVCSYRINDDYRLLFYDPYTYTNSMIMDVQFDASSAEYDTMSSYSISHTTSRTISTCVESTNSYSTATQTSGRDVTHSEVENSGTTKTIYNHSIENKTSGTVTNDKEYKYKEYKYDTKSTALKASGVSKTEISLDPLGWLKETVEIGTERTDTTNHNAAIVTDKITDTTTYSDDYKTSTDYVGDDTVEYNTTSTTDGWTELSARVTKNVGSSNSTSSSWSETEGTTVTKTYAATHFASDGITPLPWAVVHYSVQMPMKCCLQVRQGGEWVTLSTTYSLLTTIQGTCRSWMQNGQAYYEDWGNGEPVIETQFWSQFMTKEQLISSYSNKLYPTGGLD